MGAWMRRRSVPPTCARGGTRDENVPVKSAVSHRRNTRPAFQSAEPRQVEGMLPSSRPTIQMATGRSSIPVTAVGIVGRWPRIPSMARSGWSRTRPGAPGIQSRQGPACVQRWPNGARLTRRRNSLRASGIVLPRMRPWYACAESGGRHCLHSSVAVAGCAGTIPRGPCSLTTSTETALLIAGPGTGNSGSSIC